MNDAKNQLNLQKPKKWGQVKTSFSYAKPCTL